MKVGHQARGRRYDFLYKERISFKEGDVEDDNSCCW